MQDLTFNFISNGKYLRGHRAKLMLTDDRFNISKEILEEVLKPFMINYKEEKDYGY